MNKHNHKNNHPPTPGAPSPADHDPEALGPESHAPTPESPSAQKGPAAESAAPAIQPAAELVPALEQQVAGLQTELDDLQARLLRATADYQNLGRRAQREVVDARQQQLMEVAKALLAVLDHFDRALEVDTAKVSVQSVLQGVHMVRDELTKMLERFDIRRLDAKPGDAFEPARHEAMLHQAVPGVPAGHVASQLQPGYTLGDRVLRPAKVSVAQ
jgi:molecular chaperone GrpE